MTDAEKLAYALETLMWHAHHWMGCLYNLGLGCDCGLHDRLAKLGIDENPANPDPLFDAVPANPVPGIATTSTAITIYLTHTLE